LGNCIYCGEHVGFLRKKHSDCERQVRRGIQFIENEISSAIRGTERFDKLERTITDIARSSLVPITEQRNLLLKGWESSAQHFLEDDILDESKEKRLVEFKEKFGLSQIELDRNGVFTKITKAAVLRNVMNGVISQPMLVNGNFSINFQKNEKIVWAFSSCDYLEDKTRRQYIGSSQGVNIRIMKGVYYKVGAFKGQSIEHTERVRIDNGWVVITNKHIYFAGTAKSFRVPYSKIISFLPFDNGIGIVRDAANAKPQIFVTGDGWFSYNLVMNLAQL
jgi:hypothetical protein